METDTQGEDNHVKIKAEIEVILSSTKQCQEASEATGGKGSCLISIYYIIQQSSCPMPALLSPISVNVILSFAQTQTWSHLCTLPPLTLHIQFVSNFFFQSSVKINEKSNCSILLLQLSATWMPCLYYCHSLINWLATLYSQHCS